MLRRRESGKRERKHAVPPTVGHGNGRDVPTG